MRESTVWCPLADLCLALLGALCLVLLPPAVAVVSSAVIAVPGDQPTIQDAVDAAGPGDTIQVAPGVYFEAVRVNGAQDGLTIEAMDPADPPVIHGTPHVSNDGIRVDGIHGVTIRNVHIVGAYNGVRLNGVTSALLTGLYIEDNALGIRVYLGQDNRVEECTIAHTRVEQGIFIDSSPGIVLAQNFVTDAAHGGIRVLGSPCATLIGNHAIDNRGSDGIGIDHSDGARVHGCVASGNYRHGFLLSNSHGLTLGGNTADDNLNVGLQVDGCAPFDSVADVAGGNNSGSGNPQGDIVVVAPSSGSTSSVVCAAVATPTPTFALSTPTPPAALPTLTPTAALSTPTLTATLPTPTVAMTATSTPSALPTSTAALTISATPTVVGTASSTPVPTTTVVSTPLPSPLATTTIPPAPTASPTPIPADPTRCRRAVSRAGGAFAKAKVSALKTCEERLLKGKFGPDPGPGARLAYCLADRRTAAKIDRARARLERLIDRECGGLNGVCGDVDDNLDMQSDLGFPSVCPDVDGAGCTNDLTDCREASACIECIHDAATDRAIALFYDDFIEVGGAATSKSLAKCQKTMGKETVRYLLARMKALGKCWHDRFKGKHAEPCPTLSTQASIRRADLRRIGKICRICGGADAACDQVVAAVDPGIPVLGGSGGGDDLTPGEIGFASTCPDVMVPANASHGDTGCFGPVVTLADAAFCLGCVAEFAADCSDRSGVQPFAPYPVSCSGSTDISSVPTPTP